MSALYSKGNMRVSDIAECFGVSERTVYRRLGAMPEPQIPCPRAREVVVLMDATYWGWHFGVIIMKDALLSRVLWHKFLSKKETIADYREGILWLERRGFIIRGIVSDGLKGLREAFPQYKFQLCQFHQVKLIKSKLTSHPKLPASQELLQLALLLCHTDKESFIGALDEWHTKWADFLSERATGSDGKSHYVHKSTRSAYLSLRRNMPWLWTWYDHPELQLPNTNNALESLNSNLKGKLCLHRGISIERRKALILAIIYSHNPHG